MARNLDPKCKQCRRLGEKLFLKGERCFSNKCTFIKRNYPPGLHGQKTKVRKMTGFAQQLREKQKAKKIFGILEKQFHGYYKKAKMMKGNTAQNLLQLLNLRFDNIIFKGGLAPSHQSARLLISHGHFQIDGQNVNIPSYQLKPGQQITIKEKVKNKKYWQELLPRLVKKERPNWLDYDEKNLSLKVLNKPTEKDLENIFDPSLIIEYYSK